MCGYGVEASAQGRDAGGARAPRPRGAVRDDPPRTRAVPLRATRKQARMHARARPHAATPVVTSRDLRPDTRRSPRNAFRIALEGAFYPPIFFGNLGGYGGLTLAYLRNGAPRGACETPVGARNARCEARQRALGARKARCSGWQSAFRGQNQERRDAQARE